MRQLRQQLYNDHMKSEYYREVEPSTQPRPAIHASLSRTVPHSKTIAPQCPSCQLVQAKAERESKVQRMQREEQRTEENQRYIAMERKYLLTESQLLSLREQTHCLTQQMQNMHAELAAVREELERTQGAHQMLEEEVVAMRRQAAVWTQREQQLEKVVALFLEQGAAVLRWTSLLEGQEGDELPPSLYMMREDMIFRRFDLEVSLREVSNYQRQLISPEQEESLSLGCESFLKYLGRDPNSSPPSPLSDSSNKENMDCSNRPCIRTSLPSRCKTAVKGQKGQFLGEDYLRMMLVQAKALQGGQLSESKIEIVAVDQ